MGAPFGVLRILRERDSLPSAALNSWVGRVGTTKVSHVEFPVVVDQDDVMKEVDEIEPETEDDVGLDWTC